MSVAVADSQLVILHAAFPEYLLVAGFCPLRVGEVVRKIVADEFLPRETGRMFSGGIDIRDLAFRGDGDQRIEAGLNQGAIGAGSLPGFFRTLQLSDIHKAFQKMPSAGDENR